MPKSMIGRRIAVPEDQQAWAVLELAGDYCGPVDTGDGPTVFFLLPIARDDDIPHAARSVHCVKSPPHEFRECDDGSLEVRASIAARTRIDDRDVELWHGYLDEGHSWRSV